MIGFYNYSVILTYIGLASALFGMTQAISGNIKISLVCLMISGICDMFDGKIARSMKRTEDEKRFGIQIDSLCDLVCFGVFPAIIGYSIGMKSPVCVIFLVCYVLAALIRLAFFNVMEEKRQSETDALMKYYRGMPVTMAALIFPAVFLVHCLMNIPLVMIYSAGIVIVAFLLVLDFKVKKAGQAAMIFMSLVGIGILVGLMVFCK